MPYTAGSLVKARGREWVVLPESNADLLVLRPLGGTEREACGIYLPLEGHDVHSAAFDLPDPTRTGDYLSGRLLRDAVRLSFRAGAGPFRAAGRVAVEPRPYQLVPLLMALKLDPVRLLIADDVGIGKTVEAALIARELLDRGEIHRLAVLCPPHLAEQWQRELLHKFHIDAEVVLPSTVNRLERNTAAGQSLFDLYPFVVVSTEFIKSSRYRDEFIRTCPEFVIVDEAHTCAFAAELHTGRHLRHQLVQGLSADPHRHLVLVTATPHSGDEGAFRSLLGLLRPDFKELPTDLGGDANASLRRRVAEHLVQRRRADVRGYMDADTPFPTREEAEISYTLSPAYHKLLDMALAYAQERITTPGSDRRTQRIRWWSVLALLRSLASSPAAAAATLRARSATVAAATPDEVNAAGARLVLDLDDADADAVLDVTPGSQEDGADDDLLDAGPAGADAAANGNGGFHANTGFGTIERERLLRMARQAEALAGPDHDAKLRQVIPHIKELLDRGFQPILFCRFIATADYLAEELRKALPKSVTVFAVTGQLPPAEREARVAELGSRPQRVLVATDCLSEGINLQEHFNAVVHYDLSWNPTRHEQREGRVDRYGQPARTVRALTYYGVDNHIDGLVLKVLLRKHRSIRSSLGISVPVPARTGEVVEALMQGLLLRADGTAGHNGARNGHEQLLLLDLDAGFQDALLAEFDAEWTNATEKEKRSRTLFAQATMPVTEVAREWDAMRNAVGSGVDVADFVTQTVRLHEGSVTPGPGGNAVRLHLPPLPALREAVGDAARLDACFALPAADGVTYLSRTHPVVEALAAYVVNTALDPLVEGKARRCGAIRTAAVRTRTTLLLLRLRHHIVATRGRDEDQLLAEECVVAGFVGAPDAARWLSAAEAEALLAAEPSGNVAPAQATHFVGQVVDGMPHLRTAIDQLAVMRAEELLQDHQRVRAARPGTRYTVQPQLPVDVLGIYVLLPHSPA